MTNRKNILYISYLNVVMSMLVILTALLFDLFSIEGVSHDSMFNNGPNLFAPSFSTFKFSLFLLFFILIYSIFQATKHGVDDTYKIGPYHLVASLLNTICIFSWYTEMTVAYVFSSFTLFLVLLFLLRNLKDATNFSKVCFGIYTGWGMMMALLGIPLSLSHSMSTFYQSLFDEMLSIILIIIASGVSIYIVGRNKNVFIYIPVITYIIGVIYNQFVEYTDRYVSIIITGVASLIVIIASAIINLTNKDNPLDLDCMT